MKKLISAVLVLLMILSFAACSDSRGQGGDTTLPADGSTAAPVTEAEDTSPVAAGDYGKREFVILERELASGTNIYYEAFAEQQTGDVINDAILKRNMQVEEKHNVTLKSVLMETTAMKSAVAANALTDVSDYDIIMAYGGYTMYFAINGYVLDVNTLDIDFDNEWWFGSTMDETRINGKNAFAVGDICTASYTATVAIFYNRQLGTEKNVGDCYQTVTDGNWTYENYIVTGLNVTEDLDGDGMDAEDRYTFAAANWAYQPYFYGQGYNLLVKDTDGNPTISTLGETEYDVLTSIITLVNGENCWYLTKNSSSGLSTGDVFTNGNALFWTQLMVGVNAVRDMENFGILPLPKKNAAQENYISYLHTKTSLLSVPYNAGDTEMIGRIVEDMGYYSYKIIRPAYFDVLFDGIIAKDVQTTRMLDIIYANVFMDLVQPLGGVGVTVNTTVRNLLDYNMLTVQSSWNSIISKNKATLESVVKAYADLPDAD